MNRVKILIWALAIVIALVLVGCATIFKGSTQDVSFNSFPGKASVSVKTLTGVEVFSGETPATVKLPKKAEYVVTMNLKGYKETKVQLTQSLQGWFWGNLICGGVVGMVIDWATGAMWDLEPGQVSVTLATASAGGHDSRTYAVFMAYDQDGNLRSLSVPLIRESIAENR